MSKPGDEAARIPFSPKQVASIKESADYKVSIWSGSVRSGKTISSIFAFFTALPHADPGGVIIIAGRTLQTIERNIIEPMQNPEVFGELARHVHHTRGSGVAVVCGRTVHLIGANDSRAEGKLRGVTASLAMIDEATLVAEAFFNQMLARLSKPGARLICTTNPDSPAHWLKTNYIDREDELNLGHWLFLMDDNPTLGDDYIRDLKAMYTGLWYDRFILGKWVSAEGAIYDMWDSTEMVVKHDDLPPMRRLISLGIDYGTTNPTAGIMLAEGDDDCLYFVDEWAPRRSLPDARLADSLAEWCEDHGHPEWTFVDPSAKSFRVELAQRDWEGLAKGRNGVLDGIRTMASMLARRKLKVSDRCVNLIKELPGYRWDDTAAAKGEDKPVKQDDHFCDAARYATFSSQRDWMHLMERPVQ